MDKALAKKAHLRCNGKDKYILIMTEKIPVTNKFPPVRENRRAIAQAERSVEKPTSEITPDSSPEHVISVLKAKGAHKLAEALRTVHKHIDEKKNPQKKQIDLDL